MKHQSLKIQLKIYFILGRFCFSDIVDGSGGGVWAGGRDMDRRKTKESERNNSLKETKPKAQMYPYFLLISVLFINI